MTSISKFDLVETKIIQTGVDGINSRRTPSYGSGAGVLFEIPPWSNNLPSGLLHRLPASRIHEQNDLRTNTLTDLSNYFTQRSQAVATLMDKAVRTGSPDQLLKVAATLVDNSAESDLIAKTIGKTVSAIDKLTNLS